MKKIWMMVMGLMGGFVLLFGVATSARAMLMDFVSVGTLASPSVEVWLHERGASVFGAFDINVNYDSLLLVPLGVTFGPYLGHILCRLKRMPRLGYFSEWHR